MSDDPRIGTLLGDRYRILEEVASGGMGTVYRAEHVQLGRTVAVKFLNEWSAANPEARKRFAMEGKVMARLDHPNCASVIDSGVDGDIPYVVMDYVAGETLRAILDRGRLSIDYALDVMRQVLSALAHAHQQGVIHRDIKPGNIMVGAATGVGVQVKILDFGLARYGASNVRLTAAGATIGTPAYMAPEQCVAAPVDERTDLYACGVLLFEMLTGEKPFSADDPIEVLEMQCNATPPRLDLLVPQDFGELEGIVAWALIKEPDSRFQSAVEFLAALERARLPAGALPSGSNAVVSSRGLFALSGRWGERRGLLIGLACGVLILVLIVVAAVGDDGSEALVFDGGVVEVVEEFALGEAPESRLPDLEGLAEVKELVAAGSKDQAIRLLLELEEEHPDRAEIAYFLGRLYFDKLWWRDGIKAYRRAIELDPSYSGYEPLIKSALQGFIVAPEYHEGIAEFLRSDIGEAARPFLEETARDHPRARIRERAAQELTLY